MADRLILLASYPKSGNTWVRLVLQGLTDASRAGDVNALDGNGYGTLRRQMFDRLAPANAADLTAVELDDMMPAVNSILPSLLRDPAIVKTHELARRNRDSVWIYPAEAVATVIHLVRHPYDVAVSFANHMGWSVEETVSRMGFPFSFSSGKGTLNLPFPEPVGSWSDNVLSWTRSDLPYRCYTVRYEDLLREGFTTFHRIANFAGLNFAEAGLVSAIEAARFEKLQSQEKQDGFRERPDTSKQFFRAGKTLTWRGLLSGELQAKIWIQHGEVMRSFGYQPDGSTLKAVGHLFSEPT